MASGKVMVLGFLAQLILLLSVFDIYFKSPIISGIPDQQIDYDPLADRLVLIVADGLRSDTFYNHIKTNTSVYFR